MPPPKPPKPPQDREDRPRRGVPVPRPPIGYKGGEGDSATIERKAPPPGRVPPPRPRFDKPRGERAYRPPPRGTPPPAAWEKPRPGAPPRPRFDKPRTGAPPRFDKPRTGAPPRFDRPRDSGAPRSNDRPRSAPSRDSSPRSNDRPRFDRPREGGVPRSNERPRSGPPRFDGPRRDAPRGNSPRGARPHDGRPPRPQLPARPTKDPNEPVLAVRMRKPRYARPGDPAPVATPLVVLYEDGEVLAVEKPAGINVAQENETDLIPSLQTRASDYLLAKNEGTALIGPRARLVHRIDKDTSGVVLFAKTPRAQSILGREWEASRVEKIYLAIVRGVPELESGVVDAPIGRDHGRKKLRAIDGLDP